MKNEKPNYANAEIDNDKNGIGSGGEAESGSNINGNASSDGSVGNDGNNSGDGNAGKSSIDNIANGDAPIDSKKLLRDALYQSEDVIADLLMVECALAVVRDGGDSIRERDADELHLLLTATTELVYRCACKLRRAFDITWNAFSEDGSPE